MNIKQRQCESITKANAFNSKSIVFNAIPVNWALNILTKIVEMCFFCLIIIFHIISVRWAVLIENHRCKMIMRRYLRVPFPRMDTTIMLRFWQPNFMLQMFHWNIIFYLGNLIVYILMLQCVMVAKMLLKFKFQAHEVYFTLVFTLCIAWKLFTFPAHEIFSVSDNKQFVTTHSFMQKSGSICCYKNLEWRIANCKMLA